jgi:thioredoxin-related protein
MKPLRTSLAGITLSWLLAYTSLPQAEPSFYRFELESIGQTGDLRLEDYRGVPLILSFFEPACSWCVRQLRDLVKLQKRCNEELRVIAIGVHGRKPALNRVLAVSAARGRLTAAQASPSLLSAIGGVNATPYTLIIDTEGRYMTQLRGYIPLEKLKVLLRDRFGNKGDSECPAADITPT